MKECRSLSLAEPTISAMVGVSQCRNPILFICWPCCYLLNRYHCWIKLSFVRSWLLCTIALLALCTGSLREHGRRSVQDCNAADGNCWEAVHLSHMPSKIIQHQQSDGTHSRDASRARPIPVSHLPWEVPMVHATAQASETLPFGHVSAFSALEVGQKLMKISPGCTVIQFVTSQIYIVCILYKY